MRYDLAAMAKRAKPGMRRKAVTMRDIPPPATLATDLYRAAYAPLVDLWTRNGDSIAADYARTLAALTTDSPADLQTQLDAADGAFDRLFILLRAGIEGWAVQTERYQRSKWRGAVLSASGVDITTLIGPEDVRETVQTYVNWNVALIKDIHSETRKRIGNAVFAGLQNRSPAREVAATIRESVAMSKRRSMLVASDQLSKLSSALADERRREAGIETWEWKWSHKKHGRAEHIARDGHVYSDVKTRIGTVVDGKTVEQSPEEFQLPGRLPYCGCRSLAVLTWD